jgi:hypothetical protein
MSARLLSPRSSLLALIGDIRYTLSRLKAEPLAAALVAEFEALRDEWKVVKAQEIENQEALSDAQAGLDLADLHIDAFGARVSKTLLALVKDDRNHPLYLHFFGDKALSVFLRPKLGIELQAMRPWLVSFETSPHPSLQAMAPELGLLIVAADKAITTRDEVKTQIRTFYDSGGRRQLFDKCNALRKSIHEELVKIAQTAGLSADYADGFFRADASEDPSPPPTIESVKHAVADLETKLTAAKTLLTKLEEEEAEEIRLAAEQLSAEQQLVGIRRQQEALEKAAKELESKLQKP